jgi:hypothetical protein
MSGVLDFPASTERLAYPTTHGPPAFESHPGTRVQDSDLGIQERSGHQCRPFDFDGAKMARGNRFRAIYQSVQRPLQGPFLQKSTS